MTSSRPRPPAATRRAAPEETSRKGPPEKEISAKEKTETESLREVTTTTVSNEVSSRERRRETGSRSEPASARSSARLNFLEGEERLVTVRAAGAGAVSGRRPTVRSRRASSTGADADLFTNVVPPSREPHVCLPFSSKPRSHCMSSSFERVTDEVIRTAFRRLDGHAACGVVSGVPPSQRAPALSSASSQPGLSRTSLAPYRARAEGSRHLPRTMRGSL